MTESSQTPSLDTEFTGVRSAEGVTVDDVKRFVTTATPIQQGAFLYFLRRVKQIPGIELTVRNQGVGGYALDRKGTRRECFHFAVNKTGDRLLVCQHGDVFDPRGIFADPHPSGKYLSAYILGADLAENRYVLGIFFKSYAKITGVDVKVPAD